MKRLTYCVLPAITALSCMALGLIGDPRAFFEGESPLAGIAAHAQVAPPITPLSVNDVSWLFPVPTSLDETISIADLFTTSTEGRNASTPVWSEADFTEFYNFVNSDQAADAGERLQLPIEARSRDGWYISAVRFDPGAPGLSNDIAEQYGRSPQIRLSLHPIVKPVKANTDGTLKVHDFSVHLIFGFWKDKRLPVQGGCLRRPIPDDSAFMAIIRDLADLRSSLASLGASTAGEELWIHPALSNSNTATFARQRMRALLARHLSPQRLDAMALTGLVRDDPDKPKWIFLSMLKLLPGEVSKDGGWVRVRGPALDGTHYAEMFDPTNRDNNNVVPLPHTSNLNPVTCRNYAHPNIPPPTNPRGHSAAKLYPPPGPELAKEILDTIADPKASHVFNTDCVSCHTETSLALNRFITDPYGQIRDEYQRLKDKYGKHNKSPPTIFNLRNFGWAPVVDETDRARDRVLTTVTRRTEVDTEAVLNEINDRLRR
jgi:hypothetical protein